MTYYIKKISGQDQIKNGELFSINHYMWESKREPKTYGWTGYVQNEGIYVKIVCEEKDPKREYKNHKDMVCKDSAVEIFMAFTEEDEVLSNESMYINFEINANGAMYAKYGKGRKNRTFITEKQYEMTDIQTKIEEDRWEVSLVIPESFLQQICDFEKIKEGKTFYCNFYKIAECEEIEHYGSYSPIENPTPNFHLPIFFAEAVID